MKSVMKLVAAVIGLGLSAFAHAECPNSLSADLMVECIVTEGAGGVFDEQAAIEYLDSQEPAKKSEAKDQVAAAE